MRSALASEGNNRHEIISFSVTPRFSQLDPEDNNRHEIMNAIEVIKRNFEDWYFNDMVRLDFMAYMIQPVYFIIRLNVTFNKSFMLIYYGMDMSPAEEPSCNKAGWKPIVQ